MTVKWSASSEWVLVTGGCDGAIRFWDIRRAGCFLVLDQSRTQLGRRPLIPQCSDANKGSMVKPVIGTQSSSVKARGPQKKHVNGNGVKQSSTSKGKKGSIKQILHPGMLSIQDRATAHYGAVTRLKVTDDDMHLLSAGSDSRLRLWDVESGCNTLVNFETARLQTSKPIQLATSPNSPLAFVPCMKTVKAFNMWPGRTALTFRGHYENVNCCWFNSPNQNAGVWSCGVTSLYVMLVSEPFRHTSADFRCQNNSDTQVYTLGVGKIPTPKYRA